MELEYDKLLPSDRRVICNGAGPVGLGWLVPDLWFREAANRHDFDYWRGGNLTDKVRADLRFWINSLSALLVLRWFAILPACFLAQLYFVAVSSIGVLCWRWCRHTNRRGWDDLYQLRVDMFERR